jgi:hypothetical protein
VECKFCGRKVRSSRLPDTWVDDTGQMVCPAVVSGPHVPLAVNEPAKIETRMVPEMGITLDGVWISLDLLGELDEQGQWDADFGSAFISLKSDQEQALIARDLAVKETRGGCHRGPALNAFMASLVWPEEGTR